LCGLVLLTVAYTDDIECGDHLTRYDSLMGQYQALLEKSSRQVAQINTYENLLVSGLQSEMILLKKQQSELESANSAFTAEISNSAECSRKTSEELAAFKAVFENKLELVTEVNSALQAKVTAYQTLIESKEEKAEKAEENFQRSIKKQEKIVKYGNENSNQIGQLQKDLKAAFGLIDELTQKIENLSSDTATEENDNEDETDGSGDDDDADDEDDEDDEDGDDTMAEPLSPPVAETEDIDTAPEASFFLATTSVRNGYDTTGKIPFTKVIDQSSDEFNSETAVFKAETPGVYLFSVSATYYQYNFGLALVKNNSQRLCKVRNNGCTAVVKLEADDTVHADLWWSQLEKVNVIPVFTGVLIQSL